MLCLGLSTVTPRLHPVKRVPLRFTAKIRSRGGDVKHRVMGWLGVVFLLKWLTCQEPMAYEKGKIEEWCVKPPKNSNDSGRSTISRCISYWKEGIFQFAMLVFRAVFVYRLVCWFRKWQNHATSGWWNLESYLYFRISPYFLQGGKWRHLYLSVRSMRVVVIPRHVMFQYFASQVSSTTPHVPPRIKTIWHIIKLKKSKTNNILPIKYLPPTLPSHNRGRTSSRFATPFSSFQWKIARKSIPSLERNIVSLYH